MNAQRQTERICNHACYLTLTSAETSSCDPCSGDQAETFMMRVTRGSGITGLAGIAEASWASLGTVLVRLASLCHRLPPPCL